MSYIQGGELVINAVGIEHFNKMFDKGYKVIPVGVSDKKMGKKPLINDWQKIDWEEVYEKDLAQKWFKDIGHRITGMGVLLGKDSQGLACIDIDTDDEEIINRICQYFYSPVMKKGGKGLSIFFQTDERNSRDYYKFAVPSGGIVEVFYANRQIVIPPSWHSGDLCYEWLGTGTALWDVDPDDLPIFSSDHIESLYSLIGSSSAKAANISLPKQSQFKDGMNRTIKINQVFGRLIGDSPNPDISRISNELIIFDSQNFGDNSFFLDPRKAHNKSTSRLTNAITYVASMMRTVQNKTGQFSDTMFTSSEMKSDTIVFNTINPVNKIVTSLYDGMPDFEMSLVPNIWKDFIENFCYSRGVPKQGVFMAMLTSLGASLQGNVIIQPQKDDSWFRRTNLATAMVATSGSKKSDIVNTAIMELKKIDKELKTINSRELLTNILDIETKIETLTREKRKHGADIDAINIEIFKLQDELSKNPAQGTIFLYENAPIQKMILDSKKNQKTGLFLIKDEMKQIFADFRKKGNEDSRTFYMKGIDGNNTFNYSTISRGSDYIENFFFSLLTNVQPDVLNSYIRELYNARGENDGFLQRIILVPFGDPHATRPSAFDFDKYKKEFEIFRRAFYSEMITVHVAKEAISTYEDARFEIRTRAAKYSNNGPVASILSKHEGLLCAIAYLYEFLNSKEKPTSIGYTSIVSAMKLITYLGECAKFIFNIKDSDETNKALHNLANLFTKRHFRSGQTQSEMFRLAQSVTTRPTVFYDCLRELEVHGYVSLEKLAENSIAVHINPEVYTL